MYVRPLINMHDDEKWSTPRRPGTTWPHIYPATKPPALCEGARRVHVLVDEFSHFTRTH